MKRIWILQKMDQMISMESTGCPEDFALRLGISERTMYNYLDLLRDLGAPLRYSRRKNTYEYVEDGRILLGYKKKQTALYF